MQRSVTAHSANTVVAPLAFLTLMLVDAIFLIQKEFLFSCVSSFLYFVFFLHTLLLLPFSATLIFQVFTNAGSIWYFVRACVRVSVEVCNVNKGI